MNIENKIFEKIRVYLEDQEWLMEEQIYQTLHLLLFYHWPLCLMPKYDPNWKWIDWAFQQCIFVEYFDNLHMRESTIKDLRLYMKTINQIYDKFYNLL